MAAAATVSQARRVISSSEIGVPIAVLAIILALIAPIPSLLLDLLLVLDIMISVTVLMVAIYIKRPVEFSVFPTALLLLTLFRLSLNISATRLILMNGNLGVGAAGAVIGAFGNFVVGGNYVIGVIIFLTLIAIQYVVINHGAVRISEVTARFTLDALPGKQMSIDSDLSSGLIDEGTARERRRQLALEAEFYGAMDGATRFTQRDAIASLLITAINIVGGFFIGVFQHGLQLQQSLETYTVLTIGDGLVTVIPALMVSISGGLIVTRASSDERLSANFNRQIFGRAQPVFLASGILLFFALLPGMPRFQFLVVGAAMTFAGWRLHKRQTAPPPINAPGTEVQTKENLEKLLKVEPLSVSLGVGLVKIAQGDPGSPLMSRMSGIRRQLATELGFLLPSVRFTDNISLRNQEYVIHLKGIEIGRYELPRGQELAIPGANVTDKIDGRPTQEPAFGLPAIWIPAERAADARQLGYMVVDPVSVMGTHLMEIIKEHAAELFSRQDAKKLLDRVAEDNPKIVDDLVPKLLPLAVVHKVFQNLLRERVSIRDAVSILEALGEAALTTRNVVILTECARQAIRRSVINPFLDREGSLPAYLLDSRIEDTVAGAIQHSEQNSHLGLGPQAIQDILSRIKRLVGSPEAPTAVVTSPGARFFMQQMMESSMRNLFFVSHNEIPPSTKVVPLGVIT